VLGQAYDGVRVVELATTIAGPYCGMVLADLGADVVKVERPDRGDDARAMPPHVDGTSTVFRSVNRGKRSVSLDLREPGGKQSFLDLVARADVVVQSFRPGAADRLGLGYAELVACNPRSCTATCPPSAHPPPVLGGRGTTRCCRPSRG
jgi:CoA:oxalate CoA-transferase